MTEIRRTKEFNDKYNIKTNRNMSIFNHLLWLILNSCGVSLKCALKTLVKY